MHCGVAAAADVVIVDVALVPCQAVKKSLIVLRRFSPASVGIACRHRVGKMASQSTQRPCQRGAAPAQRLIEIRKNNIQREKDESLRIASHKDNKRIPTKSGHEGDTGQAVARLAGAPFSFPSRFRLLFCCLFVCLFACSPVPTLKFQFQFFLPLLLLAPSESEVSSGRRPKRGERLLHAGERENKLVAEGEKKNSGGRTSVRRNENVKQMK